MKTATLWRTGLLVLLISALTLLATLGKQLVLPQPAPPTSLELTQEPPPPFQAPHGSFVVQLSHDGRPSKQDEMGLYGRLNELDISGVARRELEMLPDTPELPVVSLHGLALGVNGVLRPRRGLELSSRAKTLWRLGLAVSLDDRDLTPDLGTLVGSQVRVVAHAVTLGVTPFQALRVTDEQGLVVALDYRLPDALDDPDLEVSAGAQLASVTGDCGTFVTRALELVADHRLNLRPGQRGVLTIRGRDYDAWNLASSFVTEDQRCTDLVHDIAWMIQRR